MEISLSFSVVLKLAHQHWAVLPVHKTIRSPSGRGRGQCCPFEATFTCRSNGVPTNYKKG